MKNCDRLMPPSVVQVVYGGDYKVYAYLEDGSVRLYDLEDSMQRVSADFAILRDKREFSSRLCVINDTLAFDMSERKNHSSWDCYDCDPECLLYQPIASDPLNPADSCETTANFMLHYQRTHEQYWGEDHDFARFTIMDCRKSDGSVTKAICYRRKPHGNDFATISVENGELIDTFGLTEEEIASFVSQAKKDGEWML